MADSTSYGDGDTYLINDLLPPSLAQDVFEALKKEVSWNVMSHRGGDVPRLVAVEGDIESDGSRPIYRHPADTTPSLLPFSPIVTQIKEHVENLLKQPFNHVLIQHYRSGADYISEHSDKTIDIAHGSNIVNVSVGAQRTMTLRTKNDIGAARSSQKIFLPHNSMLVMGLRTNKKWVHSIRHDNRPSQVKSPEELAFSGERISLTFRHIATFVDNERQLIWGQGARGKSKECAGRVVNGGEEAEKLIIAFGEENHKSNFDWEAFYGDGFDVLHFTVISHQK